MFVMVCEVGMSMWSTAAATAAVVSLRRLVLLHFTRLSFLQVSAQLPPRSNLCPDVAPVLLSCSRKARPLCDLGSSIPAVLLHWRHERAVESAAGSETDTHQRHTQRHIHTSSASCDAVNNGMLETDESYTLNTNRGVLAACVLVLVLALS